jgi:phage tail-like protein
MKQSRIESLLPEVFQRTARPGSPLSALLEVMEALHAPSEDVLARLETFLNPYRAPDDFVPFLARWVDLERLVVEAPEERALSEVPSFPGGLGRLRDLVAAAAFLSKWRGTAKGLLSFLEIATGVQGFEIDEAVPGADGRPRPFHVRVRVPAEAMRYRVTIERIVEMEKPAYVTYELAPVEAGGEGSGADAR